MVSVCFIAVVCNVRASWHFWFVFIIGTCWRFVGVFIGILLYCLLCSGDDLIVFVFLLAFYCIVFV